MFEDGDTGASGSDSVDTRVDTRSDRVDTRSDGALFAQDNGLILGRYKRPEDAYKALDERGKFISAKMEWTPDNWARIGQAEGWATPGAAPEAYEGLGDILSAAGLNGDAEDGVNAIAEGLRAHGLTQEQAAGVLTDFCELFAAVSEAHQAERAPTYNVDGLVDALRADWGDDTDTTIAANREFVAQHPELSQALQQPLGQSRFGCLLINELRRMSQDDAPLTERGDGRHMDGSLERVEQRKLELMNSEAFKDRSNPAHARTYAEWQKMCDQSAQIKERQSLMPKR